MPNPAAQLLRIAVPLAAAAALTSCGGGRRAAPPSAPPELTGRLMVTIEDGDFPPSAYIDDSISVRSPAASDTLTAIRLPLPGLGSGEAQAEFAQTLVSSSAMASPTSLDISADGRRALVVSRRGPAEPGHTLAQELPPDSRVTLIRLDAWPVRGNTLLRLCDEPGSVAFHPSGERAALVCRAGRELAIVEVGDDAFGASVRIPLAPLLGEGADPTHAAWSPDGERIAVALGAQGGVAVLRVDVSDPSVPEVEIVMAPVGEARFARQCVWTRDGRFIIVSDTGWLDEGAAIVVLDPPGGLHVIDARAGRVTQRVDIVPGPQAIALSPAGDRLAVVSLRKADLTEPRESERLGGALRLFDVDASRGRLRETASARCGSLPHDVAWDTGGEYVLVADFATGRVEFFAAPTGAGRAALRFTGVRIETGYGPHGVRVAR